MTNDQIDIFGGGKSTDEMQILNAIEILEKNGYIVIKTREEARKAAIDAGYKVSLPISVNDKIVTLKDLRDYFYMRLWRKHPDRQSYHVASNYPTELRLIKLFVESREKEGLNRLNAIQECVAIMSAIFDHEEEFNFKNPIDIRVLGQGKAGWITQKAVEILNSEVSDTLDKEVDRLIEKKDKDRNIDLRSKALELNELLKQMGDNNG